MATGKVQEKISVIVPIYNVAEYLPRCIESILNQTYENIECILVDDGSIDESGKICDEYKAKDKRVVVIHKNNGGLSSARNAGLQKCVGEYIAFIDSDDLIADNMFEILLKNMRKYNTLISQGGIRRFKDEKKVDFRQQKEITKCLDYSYCLKQIDGMAAADFRSVCNKLFRRELFEKINFPEGRIFEDMFVNYKLFFLSKRISVSSYKLYYYRIRNNSICGSTKAVENKDYLVSFFRRKNFYKKFVADAYFYVLPIYIDYIADYMRENTVGYREKIFLKRDMMQEMILFLKREGMGKIKKKWMLSLLI